MEKPEERSERLHKIRHSTAHVMAEAVRELFPGTRIAIGPAIEDGFYYDFELPQPLKTEDLGQIEERMKGIIAEARPFQKRVVGREEARELFREEPYKLELIRDLPEGEEISLYSQGGFTDLCRGPHVGSTRELPADAFKLLSVAGAYWRGDENNPMLQRIYGTAWASPEELDDYLKQLEEAEKRDHRRLGRELDLFSIHEEVGPGPDPLAPQGRRASAPSIEDFWRREHFARRLRAASTPRTSGRRWLWETSGHLGFYRENMYAPMEIDEADYYVKPMNCPFHIQIYKSAAALLPRPAAALGGAGHGVPLRAQRRAARPAARARLHPGRRPHLLHAGADRGRRSCGGPALLAGHLEGLRLQRRAGLPRHPAGQRPWASRRAGTRPPTRSKRRSKAERLDVHGGRGRRRLLRARRST